MRRHRNPRARLSKRPTPDNFDLDNLIHILRDNLGKADAFITAAERIIEQPGDGDGAVDSDSDDEPGRLRNQVEHLIESGKLAVRAAIYTTEEIDRRRSEA
jgi:hypothetical protein